MLLAINWLLVRRLGFSTGHLRKPARSVAVVCWGREGRRYNMHLEKPVWACLVDS
jgi:hypothetical protein